MINKPKAPLTTADLHAQLVALRCKPANNFDLGFGWEKLARMAQGFAPPVTVTVTPVEFIDPAEYNKRVTSAFKRGLAEQNGQTTAAAAGKPKAAKMSPEDAVGIPFNADYTRGYEAGHQMGQAVGYRAGYDAGFLKGGEGDDEREAVVNAAYERGFKRGLHTSQTIKAQIRKEGREEGFREGFRQAQKAMGD